MIICMLGQDDLLVFQLFFLKLFTPELVYNRNTTASIKAESTKWHQCDCCMTETSQSPHGMTGWLRQESTFLFSTLRLRQSGHHLPDDIFKCIFLNENVWISIKILLNFVPNGPVNNNPALLSSVRSHLREISKEIPQWPVTKTILKTIYLRFHSNLSQANEWKHKIKGSL